MVQEVWPAVSYHDVSWSVPPWQEGTLDVFTRIGLSKPYAAAITPAIATTTPVLPGELAALVERATVEVADFDRESAGLPVPMPAVLLRTESASSSQIEQLTSNARNLALSELGLAGKQNSALVAANTRAMAKALEVSGPVTPQTILDVHSALLGPSQPDMAGSWRTEQVWIGSSSVSPHGADYVAPVWEDVPQAIDDLCRFAGRTDMVALAQAALAHAQFEAIHPFPDGNGRVGRVLIHSLLRARGLVTHSTVPVSAGLLHGPAAYFAALAAYRAGDIEPIVAAVAHGAINAVANGRVLAREMSRLHGAWLEAIGGHRDSAARRLASLVFQQPVVSSAWVEATLGVSTATALNAIGTLERAGVLKQVTAGRRNRLWQADAALRAIDAFAARSQRRR
jgi:Fic family protein